MVTIISIIATFSPPFSGSSVEWSSTARNHSFLSFAIVSPNGALNLTGANLNASKSFQDSSWKSNSTTASIVVNSTDSQGETVTAVWRLDPTPLVTAQIIKYDFRLATSAQVSGSALPAVTASVALSSADYEGWDGQTKTPIYPNNTQTVSVANVEATYTNGSIRNSLLFQAQKIIDYQSTSAKNATLYQVEYPKYAAGDGVAHQYTIEIDLQSNRTIWIADDTIISIFKLSFVPSDLIFSASANGAADSATAIFKDPVQTAIPLLRIETVTPGSGSTALSSFNITSTTGQVSSLQNEIDHLNNQVGNLTKQNSQLQTKSSQWFSQWWAGIAWAILGASLVGAIFTTGSRLKTRQDRATSQTEREGSLCPHCKGVMPLGATFCGECGNSLTEATLDCAECGQQMPANSAFCGDCGTKIPAEVHSSKEVDQMPTHHGQDETDPRWR